MVDEITKEYLLKLMKIYEKYDVFSEGLDYFEDAGKVRLQDVYTMPYIFKYDDTIVKQALLFNSSESATRNAIARVLTNIRKQEKDDQEITARKLFGKKSVQAETVRVQNVSKGYKKVIYALGKCGKTSFLCIYALLCAYKVLGELAREDQCLERLLSPGDMISEHFEIDKNAIPVIIDINSVLGYHFDAICHQHEFGAFDFERAIVYEIERILGDNNWSRAEQVYKQNTIALLIDDIGELARFENDIFVLLKGYLKKENVRIAVFTQNVLEKGEVSEVIEELDVEQYFLTGLQYDNSSVFWMIEFVMRWYKAIGAVSGCEIDVEKNFFLPFLKNAEVISQISNLKELTDILLISAFDSCLPSNTVSVVKRLLEIKIEASGLNVNDVIWSLAKAAYAMLDSGEEYITGECLKGYMVRESKQMQSRISGSEWYDANESDKQVDEKHINESIERLVGWLLIEMNGGSVEYTNNGMNDKRQYDKNRFCYNFVKEEEKAYFVAYAIKNNLIKDETKKTRFDYIRDKIVNKDSAWRKSIVCLAVVDERLQGEIINELLELAKGEESDSYYMELLLELLINPGIDFLFTETKLFFELLNKRCNWKIFIKERSKIERVAMKCTPKECEQWVLTLLNGYQAIENQGLRSKYFKWVKEILFFCAQQCGMEDRLADVLKKLNYSDM